MSANITSIARPQTIRVYILRPHCHDGTTMVEHPVYLCEDGPGRYATNGNDPLLPSKQFLPYVTEPLEITAALENDDGRYNALQHSALSEIKVANTGHWLDEGIWDNGAWIVPPISDPLMRTAWAGHSIEAYDGIPGASFDQFTRVFTGIIQAITVTEDVGAIEVADLGKRWEDTPVSGEFYTQTLLDTLSIVESDLLRKRRPMLLGGARTQIEPEKIHGRYFDLGNGSVVTAVYDNGNALALEAGADTQQDLDALFSYAGNGWSFCPSFGILKLPLEPYGTLTVDATGRLFNGVNPTTHSEIFRAVLEERLPDQEINTASFDQLAIDDPHPAAIYVPGDMSIAELAAELSSSCGGQAGLSSQGEAFFTLFTGLEGVVDLEILDLGVESMEQTAYHPPIELAIARRQNVGDGGQTEGTESLIDRLRQIVNQRNQDGLSIETEMTDAVADPVPAVRVEAPDGTEVYPDGVSFTRDTLYTTDPGIAACAQRDMNAYLRPRWEYKAVFFSPTEIKQNMLVQVNYHRFRCSTGRKFRVISATQKTNVEYEVTLWA